MRIKQTGLTTVQEQIIETENKEKPASRPRQKDVFESSGRSQESKSNSSIEALKETLEGAMNNDRGSKEAYDLQKQLNEIEKAIQEQSNVLFKYDQLRMVLTTRIKA
jgi:hypothetical protein